MAKRSNFNFSSLHNTIRPLIIVQNPRPIFMGVSDADFVDSPVPKLVFRYTNTQLTNVRTLLEQEWESTFPTESLSFYFVDEQIMRQY